MPTILVVDDEKETVRMLCTALEIFGFETTPAESGAEALERIAAGAPDGIVLDLMMPEMDGFEVARRVRADPKSASVPIVVVTAMGELDAEERAREAGATHFFQKPVDIAKLAETLQRALDTK